MWFSSFPEAISGPLYISDTLLCIEDKMVNQIDTD